MHDYVEEFSSKISSVDKITQRITKEQRGSSCPLSLVQLLTSRSELWRLGGYKEVRAVLLGEEEPPRVAPALAEWGRSFPHQGMRNLDCRASTYWQIIGGLLILAGAIAV